MKETNVLIGVQARNWRMPEVKRRPQARIQTSERLASNTKTMSKALKNRDKVQRNIPHSLWLVFLVV